MKATKFMLGLVCICAIGQPWGQRRTILRTEFEIANPDWPDCMGKGCRVILATAVDNSGPCAHGMVRVKGEYCTQVKQECDVWLDKEYAEYARCQKYKPSVCVGKRMSKDFCIDQDEYTKSSETLPEVNISWDHAQFACMEQGKTLCNDDDWTFACEGEDMFPYATGLERNSTDCNFDLLKLGQIGHLHDFRKPSASLDKCGSPFGVRNMNGNVDEWVHKHTESAPFRSILKGGWWGPLRDRCRPSTVAHGPEYADAQVGFRCCSDVRK